MTTRERNLLLAGLIIGALTAGTIFIARQYIPSREEPTAAAASPSVDKPFREPAGAAATEAATAVQLTDQDQKVIGVETVEVKRQTIKREIIAPGKVAEPETGISTISARVGGRIDKLFINVTGQPVSRGGAVALIYSPEIFTTGEEYRLALDNRQRLNASKEAQAITEADELVRASRRRLELWGLSTEQIEDIGTSSNNTIQITTYASVAGVITKRNVAEGQYVKEGDVLFELADLGTVWIQADIFESDVPLMRTGQTLKITAPALAGGSIQGSISFLQPSIDPQKRTLSARIQVPNPQMRLRPGMFVQVSLEAPLGNEVLAVPRSAVLDTGREKVVYVAAGNGVFEKRVVEASLAGDDYYAVTQGVQAGEQVVTHGNFLIDSQTRLSPMITGMFGGSKAYDAGSSPTNASKYSLTLQSEPAEPKGGSEGTFHVRVTGPDGKPVSDAQVHMTLVMTAMPSMGMGEMRMAIDLQWNGSEYVGKGTVAMAGPWNITVEARRAGQLLGVYRSRFDAK